MAKELILAAGTAYSICTVAEDSSNGSRRIADLFSKTSMDVGTFAAIIAWKVIRSANTT